MIKRAFRRMTGWEKCSASDYKDLYDKYGGNILSNPDILRFIENNSTLSNSYFIHVSRGVADAAVCTWGNYLAGDKRLAWHNGACKVPVNFDEVIFPCHSARTDALLFPFKSKIISALRHPICLNGTNIFNARRQICIARPVTGKRRQTHRRQLKKFIEAGGSVKSINELSHSDFIDIYADLFSQRRNMKHDNNMLTSFIHHIDDVLFGSYLEFKGSPCAIQLLVKREDHNTVYIDYVNSGRSMYLKDHSVGSLCMFVNVNRAYEYADSRGKTLRFSFGNPTQDYKTRWCHLQPLTRLISI